MGLTRSEREMIDFLSNGKKKRDKEGRRKKDEKMKQEELRSIRQVLEANMRKLDELMEQDRRNTEKWEE